MKFVPFDLPAPVGDRQRFQSFDVCVLSSWSLSVSFIIDEFTKIPDKALC